MSKPVVINPLTINPFTSSWIEQNTDFDMRAANSQSSSAGDQYRGLDRINYDYRYTVFQSQQMYDYFMSKPSIELMSREITRKLAGVHPEGKNIVVPDYSILSVADSMYQNQRMEVKVMQEMTINFIVNSIKSEYQILENNNKLSIWVQKYDVDSGLQRISNGDVKLNRKQRNSYMAWRY